MVGGKNTKLSVRKRMGRAFFPREAIYSPTSRGLGNEYISFYRHPEVDRGILLP